MEDNQQTMEVNQQIMENCEETDDNDKQIMEVFNLKSEASEDFDKSIEPKDELFTKKKRYKCVDCGKLFSTGKRLNGHIQLVHTYEPSTCPFCGSKTLKNKSHLAIHIRKAHKDFQLPKEETITIAEGGKMNEVLMNQSYLNFFQTKQNIKNDCERETFETEMQDPLIETQSMGQESTLIECSECRKSFSEAKKRNDHMKTAHIFEPCSCPFCDGTILQNKMYLSKHLEEFHKEDKFPTFNEREIKTKQEPLEEPADQETILENFKVLKKKKIAKKENTDRDMNNSQYKLNKSFICDFCGKEFKKAFMLRNHKWVHSDVKPFCCLDCPKTFASKGGVNYHKLSHINEKPFLCDICSKTFTTKWIFEQHKLIHTGIKPFQCDECEKSFRLKDLMKMHKKNNHTNEHDKPFVCDLCPQALATKTKYEQHKLIHTGEKPFTCEECGRSFRLKFVMKKHKKVVHSTDNKPLICTTCLKTFKYRGMLKIHEKVHADTPSTCDVCNETFPNFSKLKVHKRTHNEESLCPQCGKSFKSKMALQGHMATGHPRKDQCRICSLCDKEFKTTSSFVQHHRKHTKQIDNKILSVCSECGKTCKSKRALLDHKRATHPSEGKHRVCSLCGQTFKNPANLRQHQRKALGCSKIGTTSYV